MYKSPFPYFGGKSAVANIVWPRLGADVRNYVEPFAGSAAMLLARPDWQSDTSGKETINDASGFVANFWRAIQHDPDHVTYYADNPVNENDLHARHAWLIRQEIVPRLEGDPEFYDAKIAGWWVWGMACWIGGGFCSGNGPWQQVEGELVNLGRGGGGVKRQIVHLGDSGQGVRRQRVHLSDGGQGVNRKRVHLGNSGQGVNRQLVHLGRGRGVNRQSVHLSDGHNAGSGESGLLAWMQALAERLERVRVCCGDWTRVCGPSVTINHGTTAMFFDPPYADTAKRRTDIYEQDSLTVAHKVREWCLEHGDDPRFRIALCGYEGEHEIPADWECIAWKGANGYRSNNGHKERIWFSPHCLTADSGPKQHQLLV